MADSSDTTPSPLATGISPIFSTAGENNTSTEPGIAAASSSTNARPIQSTNGETTALAGAETLTSSALIDFATRSAATEATALTEFHLFPKLAPELREIILQVSSDTYKFAIPTGHNGERMIPIKTDIDYTKLGRAALSFSIPPNAEAIDSRCCDVYDLSLSVTSREARAAYLSSFTRCIHLKQGFVRFAANTLVYIPDMDYIVYGPYFEHMLLETAHTTKFLAAVDHLVLPYSVMMVYLAIGPHHRSERFTLAWMDFLMTFKSLTGHPTSREGIWQHMNAKTRLLLTERYEATSVRRLKDHKEKHVSLEAFPKLLCRGVS
ncbi:uncharacterized protein LY89DRAFT_742784 [Mollisia scopiformis]|uniref:Uncharacterized protein n=1 Tax=Mollisia scopiformis TaxID=149040 RepID=A0A132B565_MOLSC|nr:uncharacterized protein LY89DRAFT_742784 [Mollisia scopiformis]KUJ07556.1 hypothetical protein LY89DRAFT_742784 [Mollisia scopiformis]